MPLSIETASILGIIHMHLSYGQGKGLFMNILQLGHLHQREQIVPTIVMLGMGRQLRIINFKVIVGFHQLEVIQLGILIRLY